jgi:serine/threonine protein kinase
LGDREFPVCWAPTEVLEAKVFSNKSDVWSFGVVLWEMYSFGREPYSDQVVEHTMQNILSYLTEGGRLECPPNCPPKVYDIMRSCWCERPEDRPTFSELQDVLKSLSSADEGNINRAELKFGPALKDEEFAEVFSGEYKKEKVTIKSLKDQRNKEWLLATDVSLMTSLNHPHLVKLLGVSKEEKSVLVVTEVMDKGCLLEHVQTNQAVLERSHLARFARDICCAMAYLEQKDLVHTDLAARNIMMSGESIKVSKVEYAVRSGRKHDILTESDAMRWTAPEALESGVFSNKSDVWSFGVVLWEMYSFGLDPYPGMVSVPSMHRIG